MKLIQYTTPTLGTWSPFHRLSSFQDLLESSRESAQPWAPALDVFETDEAITVRVEVGGMKKENFDISLEDDTLAI